MKELLKKYISEELFEDLSGFVEELFLLEYEYLILMARKFYNLFYIFHELNCEKYKKMGIPYENEGKIVSNRALPVLMDVLKTGKHKIIIGDDIIIHGRSIRDLYEKLHCLNPELDITIETFLINNDDTSVYYDIIDRIHSCDDVPTDKWRDISDRIITTFYLTGRPYISYLPSFVLETSWDELTRKIDSTKTVCVNNYDLDYHNVSLSVYFGDEYSSIKKLNCCSIAAVRFYNYRVIGKILAIPYFCANVMGRNCLRTLSDEIRSNMFTDEYKDKIERNNGADSMRLMELEYTVSLLLAKILFGNLNINIKEWPREIEKSTFSEYLIKTDRFEELDAEKYIKSIVRIDSTIKCEQPVLPPKSSSLDDVYTKIKKKYSIKYVQNKNINDWNERKNNNYIQEYVEELLLENGRIDEARCANPNQEDRSRLLGLPVTYLLDDSAKFWAKISKKVDSEYYRRRIFAEIIAAIDSGKGSIVTNQIDTSEMKCIYESLLHAGEQNYKYYETTNFPFMYGMMLLEYDVKKYNVPVDVKVLKSRFQKRFDEYLENVQIAYNKYEQDELSQLIMMNEYGRFLLNVYDKYEGNHALEMAEKYAAEIIAETRNG